MAGRGPHLIGEPVDLITMDLSYLAIADAIGQVDRQMLAPASTIVIVRPAGPAGPLTPPAARSQAPEPAPNQAGRGPGNPR